MIKHILLDYDSVIVEGWLRTLELEQTYEYVYVHNDFRTRRDCISLQKLIIENYRFAICTLDTL